MSFALASGGDSRSARLLKAEPRPKAAPQADDFAKVREAIQEILRHAADIRKDARVLSTAQKHTPSLRDLKESVRAARAAAEEATRLLRAAAPPASGGSGDQNLKRLTHTKLTENLVGASNELERSWREYAAAEAAWASRIHEASSAHAADAAASSSGANGVVTEAQRQLQLQLDAEAVSEAEVELHAAIVDEYTQDITNLARNVKDMREALLSLSEHTQSQGEVLDDIEMQMSLASDSTAGAATQLAATSRQQYKATKWIAWMLLVAVLLAVTIIAVMSQRH